MIIITASIFSPYVQGKSYFLISMNM